MRERRGIGKITDPADRVLLASSVVQYTSDGSRGAGGDPGVALRGRPGACHTGTSMTGLKSCRIARIYFTIRLIHIHVFHAMDLPRLVHCSTSSAPSTASVPNRGTPFPSSNRTNTRGNATQNASPKRRTAERRRPDPRGPEARVPRREHGEVEMDARDRARESERWQRAISIDIAGSYVHFMGTGLFTLAPLTHTCSRTGTAYTSRVALSQPSCLTPGTWAPSPTR